MLLKSGITIKSLNEHQQELLATINRLTLLFYLEALSSGLQWQIYLGSAQNLSPFPSPKSDMLLPKQRNYVELILKYFKSLMHGSLYLFQ